MIIFWKLSEMYFSDADSCSIFPYQEEQGQTGYNNA